MWIDIIEAYADALYVATAQRPVPRRDPGRRSGGEAVASPAPSPSPALFGRLGRWLARPRGRPGRFEPDADLTAAKGCG
jgi:hypothetical protein